MEKSGVPQNFKKVFGEPKTSKKTHIKFSSPFSQSAWERLFIKIGAGGFLNDFVFLFCEELSLLNPCVEAWNFLWPDKKEITIIGKNMNGALLFIEDLGTEGFEAHIGVIDPWTVTKWSNPNIGLFNLIGNWLPQNKIPNFLDQRLYTAFIETTGETLAFDEILAIKKPLSLGGKIEADNFQVENIIDYYKTTGEIYRKYK